MLIHIHWPQDKEQAAWEQGIRVGYQLAYLEMQQKMNRQKVEPDIPEQAQELLRELGLED